MKKKLLFVVLSLVLCVSCAFMASLPVFAEEINPTDEEEGVVVELLDEADEASGTARLISHPVSATLTDGWGNTYGVYGEGMESLYAAGAVTVFSISTYKSGSDDKFKQLIDAFPKTLYTTADVGFNTQTKSVSAKQIFKKSSGSCVAQMDTGNSVVWQIMGRHKVVLYTDDGPMWQNVSQRSIN